MGSPLTTRTGIRGRAPGVHDRLALKRPRPLLGAGLALAGALLLPGHAHTAEAAFIDDLLSRMTLEEKVGQLSLYPTGFEILDPNPVNPVFRMKPPEERFEDIRAGRVTGIFNGHGAAYARRIQDIAVKESRLGIPLISGADVIHGFRTVFPVPLAEAASFDPDLAERTARAAAREATAAGINWNFAPMVDVSRDARWGRIVESAGEDVYLNRIFATARTRGFQGDDLSLEDTMVATPKHFAAYGAAEGGLDYNTVDISQRTLQEVYLPPFRAAIDAGALSVMSAFNEINGIPSSAHPGLLTETLRQDWGFQGFVVSDFNSEFEIIAHGFAENERDAAKKSFLAGVDVSMNSGIFMEHLPALVASGEVPIERVDQAVRRVLQVKQSLGLFEDPYRYIDERQEQSQLLTAEHRKLARQAARASIVMLENRNSVLPLKRDASIVLVGPFVSERSNLHGPWTLFGDIDDAVPLAEGMLGAVGNPAQIKVFPTAEGPITEEERRAITDAAQQADVIVLTLGEHQGMSGEAKSRTRITLPEDQIRLAEFVSGLGKPVVVLLKTGRPLSLPASVLDSDALLVTWFLGTEEGNAIADILFGEESPSGRLPVSFPIASGQEPFYYNHKATGRGDSPQRKDRFKTRYLNTPHRAQYPFGFGLGYGDVRYSKPRISSDSFAPGEELRAAVTLHNAGSMVVEEVVQLYIQDQVGSVTRPVKELKGIKRVRLEPGETAEVRFVIDAPMLAFVGPDLKWIYEPGRFQLWIAQSSVAGESVAFTLTD